MSAAIHIGTVSTNKCCNSQVIFRHKIQTSRQVAVQALVLSRLSYGNSLHLGSPKGVIRKLQVVQNVHACTLLGLPRTQSVRQGLRDLHWLPTAQRVEFKLCIAHQALQGHGLSILHQFVTPYTSNRSLRSLNLHLLPPLLLKELEVMAIPSVLM